MNKKAEVIWHIVWVIMGLMVLILVITLFIKFDFFGKLVKFIPGSEYKVDEDLQLSPPDDAIVNDCEIIGRIDNYLIYVGDKKTNLKIVDYNLNTGGGKIILLGLRDISGNLLPQEFRLGEIKGDIFIIPLVGYYHDPFFGPALYQIVESNSQSFIRFELQGDDAVPRGNNRIFSFRLNFSFEEYKALQGSYIWRNNLICK